MFGNDAEISARMKKVQTWTVRQENRETKEDVITADMKL